MIEYPLALLSFMLLLVAATRVMENHFAIAMAMKWRDLVTPGIIVGIFGYAVGNYLGFACAYLLQAVL